MLSPFLVIGVGGSGGKTLRALREALLKKLESNVEWDGQWPEAWQLLHIDTPVNQDGESFSAPLLDQHEYVGLVASGVSYDNIMAGLNGTAIKETYKDEILRNLPKANEVQMPVSRGAGQFRAVGRAVIVSRLQAVKLEIAKAYSRMKDPSAKGKLEMLAKGFGAKGNGDRGWNPTVFIISSVAGGSGAGQFLDVAEVVKSIATDEPWVNEMFSILYAPDVFDLVGGRAGIAPNSIAALSELTAGTWRRDLTQASYELYSAMGMGSPNDERYNLGAKANLIIGRDNGAVTFKDQADVYNAVSLSLATWMTDPEVAGDIFEYAITNVSAQVTANVLPDNSGLRVPNQSAPPMRSIGFSRVSLGTERFSDYSSQRLAKATIDRMLTRHLDQKPANDQKDDEYWIQLAAEGAWPGFHDATGLNDLEPYDQILDALRPKEEFLGAAARLAAEIMSGAGQGVDARKGTSADEWRSRIHNTQAALANGFMKEMTDIRKTAEWVDAIQIDLQRVVGQTIAREGLPVTLRLLNRLAEVLSGTTVSQWQSEILFHQELERRASGEITVALGSGKNANSIPPAHSAVNVAVEASKNALLHRAEADLKAFAIELITDLVSNLLQPMVRELQSKYDSLVLSKNDPNSLDGRGVNEYTTWPGEDGVPIKFEPASNEKLLISTKSYPAEFSRLIQGTPPEGLPTAMARAIEELVAGTLVLPEMTGLRESELWATFEVGQKWSPRVSRDAVFSQFRGSFESSFTKWEARARHYLRISSRAFGKYLAQNLAEWLAATSLGEAEQNKRSKLFLAELSNTIALSAPLVKINIPLLKKVHAVDPGNETIISDIPIELESELGKSVKNALVAAGIWKGKDSLFVGNTGQQKDVEFFSMNDKPYQPLVFSSLFQPVADSWQVARTEPIKREAFLKMRRARPLPEAIPMAPEILNRTLRGWYVAKVLSRLVVDSKDVQDDNLGPKLELWATPMGKSAQKCAFPYPLYFAGFATSVDYPGIVAESITAALIECSFLNDIAPLDAYKGLADLGGNYNEVPVDLKLWLDEGVVKAGMPAPEAARAGASTDSPEARRDAVTQFLSNELESFKLNVLKPAEESKRYTDTWELRKEILTGLESLILAVKGNVSAGSGV